jgi:hypothetical protein
MKQSKYKNKFEQRGSRIYDSKKEARYSEQLELRKLAGEIKEIHPQYCLRLDVNGEHICKYYMDFMIILADDSKEYHEVKGFETDVWRLKWKLAQATIKDGKFVLIK